MISAAARATASASVKELSFIGLSYRRRHAEIFRVRASGVVPSTRRHDARVEIGRTPRAFLVFTDRRSRLEHGVDDPPCLFHVVLPGKERGIAGHGVTEHSFVRIH